MKGLYNSLTDKSVPIGNCTFYTEYLAKNPEVAAWLSDITCGETSILNLNNHNINSAGATMLAPALQQLTELESLFLSNNSIGEAGTVEISPALQYMTNLHHLSVNNNSIGDVGAKALAPTLQYMTSLNGLSLDSNMLAQQGLKHLPQHYSI